MLLNSRRFGVLDTLPEIAFGVALPLIELTIEDAGASPYVALRSAPTPAVCGLAEHGGGALVPVSSGATLRVRFLTHS